MFWIIANDCAGLVIFCPRVPHNQIELWDITSTSGNFRPYQILTANIRFNFALCACILSHFTPLDFALCSCIVQSLSGKQTFPMSVSGSQGVFISSFMPIGPKLWVLFGPTHRHSILLYYVDYS